jgi:YVTN family beta-propeller protein
MRGGGAGPFTHALVAIGVHGVLGALACAEVIEVRAPAALRLEIVSGANAGTSAVNTLAPSPPVARVVDARGAPVADVGVIFTVTRGRGVLQRDGIVSGQDGITSAVSWHYGPLAGPQEVTAVVVSSTVDARVTFIGTAVAAGASRIDATPSTLSLRPGDTRQISVSAADEFGNPVTPVGTPAFVSLGPETATVAVSGLVSGLATGVTRVVASWSGLTDTVTVIVGDRPEGDSVVDTPLEGVPWALAASAQGTVYVARDGTASLVRFDLPSAARGATIGMPEAAYDVAFLPSGALAYATNDATGSVSVVDRSTDAVLRTLDGLGNPLSITAAPDGAHVFVSTRSGTLHRINTTTDGVESITPGGLLNGLAMNPTRGVLYASATDGRIFEVSLATFAVTRSFFVNGAAQGMSVSPDGARLYLANLVRGAMEYDAASLTITREFFGSDGAFDVAVTKDAGALYVARLNAGTVTVIDLTTGAVVREHPGGRPRRFALSADGLTLLVANESGWVTFIR